MHAQFTIYEFNIVSVLILYIVKQHLAALQ